MILKRQTDAKKQQHWLTQFKESAEKADIVVLIMAAEGHGFEESEYWYDRLEKHLGWKSLGKVLCAGVMEVGDIEGKKELQDAYELGKSISQ